jgi:MFS family permease
MSTERAALPARVNLALAITSSLLLMVITSGAAGSVANASRRLLTGQTAALWSFWGLTIGAPLAGWWADRSGRRSVIAWGVILTAAGLVTFPAAPGPAWVALLAAATLGVAMVRVAGIAHAAAAAGSSWLVTIMALGLGATGFGSVLAVSGSRWVAQWESASAAFAAAGVILLATAAVPLVALRIGAILERDERAIGSRPPAGPGTSAARAIAVAIGLVLAATWLGGTSADAANYAMNGRAGLPPFGAPFLILIPAELTAIVWAVAADWTGRRTGRPAWAAQIFVVATLAVFCLGAALAVVAPTSILFSLGVFTAAVGVAGLVPLAMALLARAWGLPRCGLAVGLFIAAVQVGGFAQTWLSYRMRQAVTWHAPLVADLLVGLGVLAAAIVVARRR